MWMALLPWTCNYSLFYREHYALAPWSKAFSEPEFWRMMVRGLVPAAAVLLVIGQGLRMLDHVQRGELFCRANVRALRVAGGVGLLAAAWTLVNAVVELPWPLMALGSALLEFPTGTVMALGVLLDELVLFGFCLMGGLFFLLLSQFLRRGMELQEDSDLTI